MVGNEVWVDGSHGLLVSIQPQLSLCDFGAVISPPRGLVFSFLKWESWCHLPHRGQLTLTSHFPHDR